MRPPPLRTSASSAKVPPWPWLSALSTKTTYLSVTDSISSHVTRLVAPTAFAEVGAVPPWPKKISEIVYSGLVPMSP